MESTVDIITAEPAPRASARSGAGGWESREDLCPPWWPRRRSPRRALRAHAGDLDVRAADRVYLGLSLLASTFQLTDEQLACDLRAVAIATVVDAAGVLRDGAACAWEHADDLCPPWPLPGGADATGALPGRAAHLLDVLGLLHAYSLGARLPDPCARARATRAIGKVLHEQVAQVARTFA